MQTILWWLRRDLRLYDNVVLHQAMNDAASVIPVFILDPKLLGSEKLAPARKQFLMQSLAELDTNLVKRGSYLVVRRGDAARELVKLARETQANAIYYHADYTPYARQRDARVLAALDTVGIPHQSFNDLYLADPDQVRKADGQPYTVYSSYRAKFEQVVSIPKRHSTHPNFITPPGINRLDIGSRLALKTISHSDYPDGGEAAGRKLARSFISRKNGLAAYSESRNDMAADATSHLSPHLHFGTVSVRELVRMARDAVQASSGRSDRTARNAGDNTQVWIDELVWREFFNQVLFHFPHAARGAFRAVYGDLAWQDNETYFRAWCDGCTGYPLVDAGMRQLKATGWMHNRPRMVTASFLTKDLLINWQHGERYFMQHLVDGDMASNNGGWQWAAGTGTDAQPYFRIFNPVLSSKRFDPTGTYIRRWVPELERVPNRYIHAPWTMPDAVARQSKVQLGTDYPKPVVDHATQREHALALYRWQTSRTDARRTNRSDLK